jgi:hypothetical protein
MPITANIIQIAKHTVNANVLITATDHWRVRRLVPDCPELPACIAVSSKKLHAESEPRAGRDAFHDPHQALPDVWSLEETGATTTVVDGLLRLGATIGNERYPFAHGHCGEVAPRVAFSGKISA